MPKSQPNTPAPQTLFFFRRLFWRIFFSFWLASLSIMLVTSYFIIGKFESDEFLKRHHMRVLQQAANIVAQHEEGSLPQKPPHRPFLKHRNKLHQPPGSMPQMHQPLKFSIYDDQENLVFGPPNLQHKTRKLKHLQLFGATGAKYQVFSPTPRAPTFFREALLKLNSIQFVLILIASTLVSVGLSWTITRPLKQLGNFSRQFSMGDNTSSLPPSLLKRGDELGDLAKDMAYMTAQMEQTVQAQQQLLHDVSHELRAPLARLQARIALIEQSSIQNSTSNNDTSPTNDMDKIHEECQRINQLIQQILDYSRLNKTHIDSQPIDLNDLLDITINNIQLEFPEHTFDTRKLTSAFVITGCKQSLGSAFENILRNACKYSSPEQAIELQVSLNNNALCISIHDTGPGVVDSDLHKLTQPFYRAGNAMHTDGFGLGLSIAKKALEKHGGELIVHNHPNGGLVVDCYLPESRITTSASPPPQ